MSIETDAEKWKSCVSKIREMDPDGVLLTDDVKEYFDEVAAVFEKGIFDAENTKKQLKVLRGRNTKLSGKPISVELSSFVNITERYATKIREDFDGFVRSLGFERNDSVNDSPWVGEGTSAVAVSGNEPVLEAVVFDEQLLERTRREQEDLERQRRAEREREERERLRRIERDAAERRARQQREEEEDEQRVRELEERARRARNGEFDVDITASSQTPHFTIPSKKPIGCLGTLIVLSLIGWIGKTMEERIPENESADVENFVTLEDNDNKYESDPNLENALNEGGEEITEESLAVEENTETVDDDSLTSAEMDSMAALLVDEYKDESEPVMGEWTDPRDSQRYPTRQIGSLVWLLDNMNYSYSTSFCYDDEDENCSKYGRLYTWSDAKVVCRTPWRLPSRSDWSNLEINIGLLSENPWEKSFFRAKSGGFRSKKGVYELLGQRADFWSADEFDENAAYYYYFVEGDKEIHSNKYSKNGALSVRCVKNL